MHGIAVSTRERTAAEADTRTRIIAAARDLFVARGFSKVTMDELAGQLGISKKTLYRHFDKKDDLVDAAFEWQMLYIRQNLTEIFSRPGDFLDRLYAFCAFITGALSRVNRAFLEDLRRFRPDLWKKIEEFRRARIEGEFAKVIADGRRIGVVRGDVNVELFIAIFLAAVQGVVNPETLSRHPFTAEEAYRGVVGVMFEGILADGAKPLFRARFRQTAKEGKNK